MTSRDAAREQKTDAFRKKATALSLLGFVLASVGASVAMTLLPAGNSPADQLVRAKDHAGLLLASRGMFLLATALFLPAVFGLLRLMRDRGARLAHIGAALAVLGALGHMALIMHSLFLLQTVGGDAAEMEAFLARLDSSPVVGMVVFPLVLSFGVALLLLAIGLHRAGVMPRWGLIVMIVAFLLIFTNPDGLSWIETIQNVLVAASFGWVGVLLLRMSDREWAGRAQQQRAHEQKGPGAVPRVFVTPAPAVREDRQA